MNILFKPILTCSYTSEMRCINSVLGLCFQSLKKKSYPPGQNILSLYDNIRQQEGGWMGNIQGDTLS